MECRDRILIAAGYANSLLNFRGELLEDLVSKGVDVHVTAPGASMDVVARLKAKGAMYHDVSVARAGMNPVHDIAYVYKMMHLIRRIRPTMYLGYTVKPMVFGNIAARLAGVHSRYAIVTGLGYLYTANSLRARLTRLMTQPIFRVALKSIDAIIFQNPDDREQFLLDKIISQSSATYIVNGSGVNIETFSPRPLPVRFAFLFVGRLVREKGIYEYLEAANEITRRYPGIRFYVAGSKDDNPSSMSETEVSAMLTCGAVDYLGNVKDIRAAIEKASVLVLPSYREGTPRAVLEAMAMGRAIITTTVPGCKETIRGGEGGILVRPKDVYGLVKAMEELIKHPKLVKELGVEARRQVVRRYDVRIVNNEILRILGVDE